MNLSVCEWVFTEHMSLPVRQKLTSQFLLTLKLVSTQLMLKSCMLKFFSFECDISTPVLTTRDTKKLQMRLSWCLSSFCHLLSISVTFFVAGGTTCSKALQPDLNTGCCGYVLWHFQTRINNNVHNNGRGWYLNSSFHILYITVIFYDSKSKTKISDVATAFLFLQ